MRVREREVKKRTLHEDQRAREAVRAQRSRHKNTAEHTTWVCQVCKQCAKVPKVRQVPHLAARFVAGPSPGALDQSRGGVRQPRLASEAGCLERPRPLPPVHKHHAPACKARL